MQEHRVNANLDLISQKSSFLLELYRDDSHTFEAEVKVIVEGEFAEFYRKLKIVKDFYRVREGERVVPFDPEATRIDAEYELAGTFKLMPIWNINLPARKDLADIWTCTNYT